MNSLLTIKLSGEAKLDDEWGFNRPISKPEMRVSDPMLSSVSCMLALAGQSGGRGDPPGPSLHGCESPSGSGRGLILAGPA